MVRRAQREGPDSGTRIAHRRSCPWGRDYRNGKLTITRDTASRPWSRLVTNYRTSLSGMVAITRSYRSGWPLRTGRTGLAAPPEFGRRCSIVTTDRNGDAKPDLVIASYSGSSVLAARGTENGEFAPWTCCGFGEMGALADWESERGRRSGFRGGVSAIARRSLSSTVRQAAGQGRESFRSSLELVARPGRGDGRFGAPISTALGMTMTGADHDRR
jgi:hypothetical protein